MSRSDQAADREDRSPGDEDRSGREFATGLKSYGLGLGLAATLTAASFLLPGSDLIWRPGVPIALLVFAIAQMGVHLVFFLHLNTAPDSTNNIMALAFGLLICFLVIGGSVWIMAHLNHNMSPGEPSMDMAH